MSNGVVAKPVERQAVRRRWPLAGVVSATVLAGLLGAAAGAIGLNFLVDGGGLRRMLHGNLGAAELDVIKIALSVVAGVGGAVALVVA